MHFKTLSAALFSWEIINDFYSPLDTFLYFMNFTFSMFIPSVVRSNKFY